MTERLFVKFREVFTSGALPVIYCLMLLVIFILPFYSVEEYSILKNTTSQLGAQGAPHAWIMNVVFAALGIVSVTDGWRRLSGYWLHRMVLAVFGISLFMTAFFHHAPIVSGVPFSQLEDDLHSGFASAAGFAFTVFAIASAFIEPTRLRRIMAVAIGVSATLLSILIFRVPDLAGIWQRIIFIVMFAWLIYFLHARTTALSSRR
jgi:hypothetical membrane protein